MPRFEYQHISSHPLNKLYELIRDVESYPEFLPWCKNAKILEEGKNFFVADLIITFKVFTERYRSRVNLIDPDNGKAQINVSLIHGPFKHLNSCWHLSVTKNNQTKVRFMVDFEFKSILLEKLIGLMFTKACEKMINVFEKRAEELFGAINGSTRIKRNRRRAKKA